MEEPSKTSTNRPNNEALEPTPIGALSSAIAGLVVGPA